MTDPVIKSEFILEGDTLTHKATQPTEKIILDRNAELRKNPNALLDLGHETGDTWGRQVASIPEIMFARALRDGYALNSSDAQYAEKELMRFLNSEEGKKCLIRERL